MLLLHDDWKLDVFGPSVPSAHSEAADLHSPGKDANKRR
jgi:hypothetical protein